MSVFVSNQHLYVQFVDDAAAKTLAAVSTLAGPLKGQPLNVATAKQLGELAAQAAKGQRHRRGRVRPRRVRLRRAPARADEPPAPAACSSRSFPTRGKRMKREFK